MEESQNIPQIKGKKNISKLMIIGAVIFVIIAVGYLWVRNSGKPGPQADVAVLENNPISQAAAKTFTVVGQNFSFSPSEIRVKQGDKVKIIFQDEDGFHDLVVDGYNAKTDRITGGHSSEAAFTADKTGQFEYYCSVANHREQGMRGTLYVE